MSTVTERHKKCSWNMERMYYLVEDIIGPVTHSSIQGNSNMGFMVIVRHPKPNKFSQTNKNGSHNVIFFNNASQAY